MRHQEVKQVCEQNSIEDALEALRQRIARCTDKDGLLVTAIPGLSRSRWDAPNQPNGTASSDEDGSTRTLKRVCSASALSR